MHQWNAQPPCRYDKIYVTGTDDKIYSSVFGKSNWQFRLCIALSLSHTTRTYEMFVWFVALVSASFVLDEAKLVDYLSLIITVNELTDYK